MAGFGGLHWERVHLKGGDDPPFLFSITKFVKTHHENSVKTRTIIVRLGLYFWFGYCGVRSREL